MSGVRQAHRTLYDAIESADLELMRALWKRSPDTICVHPGAEPLVGTDAVLRSWALVMANTEYIQFFLTDVSVSAPSPDVSIVTCTENILASDSEPSDALIGGKVICTSVLTRAASGQPWMYWSRHASTLWEPDLDDRIEAPK